MNVWPERSCALIRLIVHIYDLQKKPGLANNQENSNVGLVQIDLDQESKDIFDQKLII